MKINELDFKNKKLINLLQEDGRNTLTGLGGILNLSHVSVQKRLKKLLEKNQVHISANLSSSNLEISFAVILVEVDSYKQLKILIEKHSKCPRLVFFGTMTGAYNVISIVAAENQDTLQSVINVCSMRNEPGLRRSDVFMIDIPLKPQFIPFKLPIKGEAEISPCNASCEQCERHRGNKCTGCPGTKWYGLE
ncbi:MAG: AsnC family transcriptional regulator [Candidatus Helarchaeota archaeon]|nr:AsnC family transcriptional regulator [Candidatus Helarchaeota archaeon]